MRSRTPAITASSAARSPSWARATKVSIGVVTFCVCKGSICSISATNGTCYLCPKKDRQNRELLGQSRALGREDLVAHAGELELREDVLGARVVRDNSGVGDGLQPRRDAHVKVNRTARRIGDNAYRHLTLRGLHNPGIALASNAAGKAHRPPGQVFRLSQKGERLVSTHGQRDRLRIGVHGREIPPSCRYRVRRFVAASQS